MKNKRPNADPSRGRTDIGQGWSALRVYPNPWLALDKNGVPCAVCPRDPDQDGGGPLQFVGARIDKARTVVTQKLMRGDDIRSPMQNTGYTYLGFSADDPELRSKIFWAEPIEVPSTNYYRARLRDRSLLSADEVHAMRKHLAKPTPPKAPAPEAPPPPPPPPPETKADAPPEAPTEPKKTADASAAKGKAKPERNR